MDTLRSALARQLPAEVTGLRRLPGGASRETWSFTAGGEPLIALTAQYESFASRAAFEVALRWLADHRPPASGRHKVVHGDFRTGNLMITPSGSAGV